MAEQNSKVVGGGVVLLLLWGGLGLFFGVGKGKGDGSDKAKVPEKRANIETRQKPRERIVKRRSSPLVKVALQKPTGAGDTTLPNTKPVQPLKGKPSQFSFVLRLKYIHPILPDGSVSKKTISLQDLVTQGKKAAEAKQELHLRVRGDARARWEKKIKQTLRDNKVTFSVTNEF